MEDQRQKAETFLKSLPDLSQKICRLWPPGVVSVSAELDKHLNELDDGTNLFPVLPSSVKQEYMRKAGEVVVNSGLIALLCEKATPWLGDKQGDDVTNVIWALGVCTVGTRISLNKDGDLHRLLALLVNLLKESFLDHMAGTLQQGGDALGHSLCVLWGLARVEENQQHIHLLNILSVLKAYSTSKKKWISSMARLETKRRADIPSPNHDMVQFRLGQLKALEREGFNPNDRKLSGVFRAVKILTLNPGNRELVVQEGVLPYLEKGLVKCVSMNRCKEWPTCANIVITLQNLVCAERNKAEITKHKQLLDSLVSISIDQSHSHRPDCIESAKYALSNLGMNPQDMQNDGTRRTGLLNMSSETEDSGRQIPMYAPQRMDITNNGLTSSLPNGSPNLSSGVQLGNIPPDGSTCSMQVGNMTGILTSCSMPPLTPPSIMNAAFHGGMSNNIPLGHASPFTIQGNGLPTRLSDTVPTSCLAPGGMLTNVHSLHMTPSGMSNDIPTRHIPGNVSLSGSMSNDLQTDSVFNNVTTGREPCLGMSKGERRREPDMRVSGLGPAQKAMRGYAVSGDEIVNINNLHVESGTQVDGNSNSLFPAVDATKGQRTSINSSSRTGHTLNLPTMSGTNSLATITAHIAASATNYFLTDGMAPLTDSNTLLTPARTPNSQLASNVGTTDQERIDTDPSNCFRATTYLQMLCSTSPIPSLCHPQAANSTSNSQLFSPFRHEARDFEARASTCPSTLQQRLGSKCFSPSLCHRQAANSMSNTRLPSPDRDDAWDFVELRGSSGPSTSQQRRSNEGSSPSLCHSPAANSTSNSRLCSPDIHDARDFEPRESTGPSTSRCHPQAANSTSNSRLSPSNRHDARDFEPRETTGPGTSRFHPQAANSTSNSRLSSPDRHNARDFETKISTGPSTSQQRRSSQCPSPSLCHSQAATSNSRLFSPDRHDARDFEARASTCPSTSQQRGSSQCPSPSRCHPQAANRTSNSRLSSPDRHDARDFETKTSTGPSTSQQRRSSQCPSPSLCHPQAASSTSNQRLPSPDRDDMRDFDLRESPGPGTSQQRTESRSSRHSSTGNSGNHTPSSTSSSRPSSADSTSVKDSSDDELSRSSSPVTFRLQSRPRRRTPYRRTPSRRVPLAQRNKFRALQPVAESVTMKNPLDGETSKTSHPGSFQQRCNPQGRIFRPSATVSRGTSTSPCTHPSPAFSTPAPVPPTVSFSARGLTCCLYFEESQPRTSGSSHHCSDRWQLIFSNESQPSEYRHPPSNISYLPRSSGKQQGGRSPDPDENFNDFQPLSQQNSGSESHVPEHQAFSSCRPPGDPGLSPMGQGSFSSVPRQHRKWASGVKTEGLQTHSQTSASLSRANEMTCEKYLLCPECGLSYTSQNDSQKGRGKRRNQSECPDCQPSRKYTSSVKKHKSHSIAVRKHGNALPSKTCGQSSESKHSTYSPKATVMSAEYKSSIASGMFRNSDSSARPFSKAKTKHSKHSPSRSCGPAVSCHEIPSKSSGMNIPKMPLVKAENSPQTSKQVLKTEPNDSKTFQHQECIASNKPWTENACTKQQKDTRVKRKCPHCSEDFVSADAFLFHMKHKKHFKCRECVKCFAYKKTLAKHIKDKHDPENESCYKCMVCDKEFGCERYMKEHEKVHGEHAYERYKCRKCEKGFPYRSIFNKHIKLCR